MSMQTIVDAHSGICVWLKYQPVRVSAKEVCLSSVLFESV